MNQKTIFIMNLLAFTILVISSFINLGTETFWWLAVSSLFSGLAVIAGFRKAFNYSSDKGDGA